MFDHVFMNVSDKKKSTKFYSAALGVLGIEAQLEDKKYTAYGPKGRFLFWLNQADKGATKNMHLAFDAESREQVHEFYKAALRNGGKSNGEPGPRPQHGEHYFAAFVFDPDGNNIEAVCYKKE
jgi:predicted lactoylglutathione lyase